MTAITTISDIINRLTDKNVGSPQIITAFKDGRIPTGAAAAAHVIGRWSSLWQYVGLPSNGLVPTGSDIPSNITIGALKQISPTAGQQQWLLGAEVTSLAAGTFLLYDRLMQSGGFSGTLTGTQGMPTGTTSLTRYTGGVGNQLWLEIYTAIGATRSSIFANYTNQAGSPAVTKFVTAGSTSWNEAQRMIPIALSSGDNGVRAISSVVLSGSTGTAGNFGINIIHPLCYINAPLAGVTVLRDFITGLPTVVEIQPGACLAFAWLAGATTVPQIHAMFSLIDE